jgi:acyl-coenzyme A thioesterase PaaI-like protein
LAPNVTEIPAFEPADPRYAERVRSSFARQGAMRLIGAEMIAVAPGYCAVALVPRAEVAQQHGYVHAGVVAAIVDSAGGYAGFTLFDRCIGAHRRVQFNCWRPPPAIASSPKASS